MTYSLEYCAYKSIFSSVFRELPSTNPLKPSSWQLLGMKQEIQTWKIAYQKRKKKKKRLGNQIRKG